MMFGGFWGLLAIGFVVWWLSSASRPSQDTAVRGARRTLDERYARGEIDHDEYMQRLAVLERR